VDYGKEHEGKTIIGHWQWIWFTDEAHFQSIKLQNITKYELRKAGQERQYKANKKSGLDVTLHVAVGVSYNHKRPLIFYKDPQEPLEKVRKPSPPRKSKYETQEQFKARLKVFEDTQPKEDTTPKGNCMTQVFYARQVLPEHIKQIKLLEERHNHRYYLQEDGDPSHGNRSENNPPWLLKRDSDLAVFIHPPQSPDLNPVEACWLILKKRLRGREWSTVAQFKADIQAEWNKITLAQIRRRIREMPERCRKVQLSGGERIKSPAW
jgi:transposase